MDFSKNKKGQGLPLNTIVIAILVIIVLLVIIVFFTTRIGGTGETLDDTQNGFVKCESGTLLIPEDKYKEARDNVQDKEACDLLNGDVITGASAEEGAICCAIPN